MAEQQHIEQPPSSYSAEDDENAELFSVVLSTFDKEQLPLLASAILQRLQPLYQTANAKLSIGEPLYGSYHVLFPLTFDDISLRWIVKILINGTESKWDELSTSALTSEANTIQLLKRETTIRLPGVLDFSATQNTFRRPYIIMTFISGVWFGNRLNSANPKTTRLRRIRALESIASAMAQLGRFHFKQAAVFSLTAMATHLISGLCDKSITRLC